MTPHIILVGATGPTATGARDYDTFPADEAWTGKTFRLRCLYARRRSETTGRPWGIISSVRGVLPSKLATVPHGTTAPPIRSKDRDGFRVWQQACRRGLGQIVDRVPLLHDVPELRLELHVPPSWRKAITWALPEHRVSFPLGELQGRATEKWYSERGVVLAS